MFIKCFTSNVFIRLCEKANGKKKSSLVLHGIGIVEAMDCEVTILYVLTES